jgi:hypothetical protein
MVAQHKTKNKYSPEEFGLTSEIIDERFDYVYRNYPGLKGEKKVEPVGLLKTE